MHKKDLLKYNEGNATVTKHSFLRYLNCQELNIELIANQINIDKREGLNTPSMNNCTCNYIA